MYNPGIHCVVYDFYCVGSYPRHVTFLEMWNVLHSVLEFDVFSFLTPHMGSSIVTRPFSSLPLVVWYYCSTGRAAIL